VASILIAGPDVALLEGLSQTLVGAGHNVASGRDVSDALEHLQGTKPLVAVVDRDELVQNGMGFRVALSHGGALIAYHRDEAELDRLPFEIKRATLAELRLPLERQRLLALIRSVESRARAAGRDEDEPDIMEARNG
jgi:DNA-binding NtrC family response regulator